VGGAVPRRELLDDLGLDQDSGRVRAKVDLVAGLTKIPAERVAVLRNGDLREIVLVLRGANIGPDAIASLRSYSPVTPSSNVTRNTG
jgi:signal recognition particle GTPase